MGKFSFRAILLTTIIRDQPDEIDEKPAGVISWKNVTSCQAWEYNHKLKGNKAATLEKTADVLTMCYFISRNTITEKC